LEPTAHPAVAGAAQTHEVVEQQAPGQTLAQVPPQVKALGAMQAAGATTVQAPVTLSQHLPVQGLGEQVLAAPW
jgi:hypothetical protein